MTLNLKVLPLKCEDEILRPTSRVTGLPYGEGIMIVGRTVWAQSTSVSDRQTGGQNEHNYDDKTALCEVSHDDIQQYKYTYYLGRRS